jgi:retinaldehyde-binding protein 1
MNNCIARSVLEGNHKSLIDQYKANLADVCALQSTLNDEILSHVAQEFALSDADHTWAKEWISDTATIFRFLRHHRFVRSFALEAIHTTLIWRLNALRLFALPSTLLHCLPPPICDPLGRPLVFLQLSELLTCEQTMMDGLLISLDRLRIHLRSLNTFNHELANREITLQCVFVIDLEGLSIQSVNLKILTWFMEEVVPRYPGMLGAVFFLNYSWTYAMTWSIAKCVYFRHVFGLLDQNSGAYFLNPRLPESSFHPGRNFFNTVLRQRCHLIMAVHSRHSTSLKIH